MPVASPLTRRFEMSEAMLYRDEEYGALAVIPAARGRILVLDHAFNAPDLDAALSVLEGAGEPREERDGTVWSLTTHPEVVRANIDAAMLLRGYDGDPLGARAVLRVDEATARVPDLPGERPGRIAEDVERALRSHVAQGFAAFAPGVSPSVAVFSRPRRDIDGGFLPFVRARALVSSRLSEADARRRLRESFSPVAGALVRATAALLRPGVYAVEVAIAPPPEAARMIREVALPIFSPVTIEGVREVRILLNALLSEREARDLAARAVGSTAAVRLERPSERIVLATVPGSYEGSTLLDEAFQARVAWIFDALGPWDPSLEDIGEMAPL